MYYIFLDVSMCLVNERLVNILLLYFIILFVFCYVREMYKKVILKMLVVMRCRIFYILIFFFVKGKGVCWAYINNKYLVEGILLDV